jgi:ABC-type multidrug transport system fused ATPase/permease subunit
LLNIVDGKFWRTKDSEPILRELNLQIKRETLVAVVGPSGCGKTTLFEALLGELPCPLDSIQFDSAFDVQTGIAYCSQQPWLRNDTVRSNIIAGMPYNEAWYKTVIDACAMEDIVHTLGEKKVGSGGTSLSGGQKQRIVSISYYSTFKVAANPPIVFSARHILASLTCSAG